MFCDMSSLQTSKCRPRAVPSHVNQEICFAWGNVKWCHGLPNDVCAPSDLASCLEQFCWIICPVCPVLRLVSPCPIFNHFIVCESMRSMCQQKRLKKKQETITIQVTSFNSCTSVKARPKCGKGTPFAGLTLARVRRWTWSFSEKKTWHWDIWGCIWNINDCYLSCSYWFITMILITDPLWYFMSIC